MEALRNRGRDAAILLALLGVGGVMLFWELDRPHLARWDESTHGRIAVEMVQDGQYLIPTTHHKYRKKTGKPVFGYWMIIAAAGGTQPGVFHVRAPGVIGTLATLALLFAIARRRSLAFAIATSAAFLLFPGFLRAREGWFEHLLTPLFLGAFWAYAHSATTPREKAARRYAALSGLLVGCAILTKNIYGLFPIMAIGLWEAVGIIATKRTTFGGALRRLGLFGAVAIGASGWWYVYMYVTIGEPFVDGYLVTNTVGRFIEGETLGRSGMEAYYSGLSSLTQWAPAWICLLGALFLAIYRRPSPAIERYSSRALTAAHGAVEMIGLFSLLHIVLLGALAASWRGWYLLPMLPVLALGAGYIASEAGAAFGRRDAHLGRNWAIPLVVAMAINALAATLAPPTIIGLLAAWLLATSIARRRPTFVEQPALRIALGMLPLAALALVLAYRITEHPTFNAQPSHLARAAKRVETLPAGPLYFVPGNISSHDEYLMQVYFRRRLKPISAKEACRKLGSSHYLFFDRRRAKPACIAPTRRNDWGPYALGQATHGARPASSHRHAPPANRHRQRDRPPARGQAPAVPADHSSGKPRELDSALSRE